MSVGRDLSDTVSSLDLVLVGIIELDFRLVEEGLVGVMIRDLAGTVYQMEQIPGRKRRERSSLDVSILEFFGRLLIPSLIFVT